MSRYSSCLVHLMLLQPCRLATAHRHFLSRCRHVATSAIVSSESITQLKSTFQAYAAKLPAVHESHIASHMKSNVLPQLIQRIHETEPRTRRASHAMYAWRVRTSPPSSAISSTFLCGSSNGGEAGAGERLERLLELGRCEDSVVIVFRWYGGVKLGSDRWRCISSVAKDALERGGFLPGGNAQGDGSKKKRRR